MNAIAMINTSHLTMSSYEIAILVEARHDNVKRTIQTLGEKGVISLPQIEEVKIPRERREETVLVYNLGKRDSLVVVAQLCPEFTAKIVDRWQELEAQLAKPTNSIPQSLPEALRLAADLAEQKAEVEAKLAVVEPKALALDRMATATQGSFCIRDAAKNLQVQEKWLRDWLIQNKWVYRRPMGSELLAYSDKIQSGVVEHKITTGEKSDGTEWTSTQARITAKGMAKLAQALTPIFRN